MHTSATTRSILLSLFATLLAACKASGDSAEASAGVMLGAARELLAAGDYSAARDTILSLRQQHPTALQTRGEAIVTLDSIELMETRDSLAAYEAALSAARMAFEGMQPRVNGRTNEAYYAQQRLVHDMEFHFDELCAKVKFYMRKIDIDRSENRTSGSHHASPATEARDGNDDVEGIE